jgi:hypothetical protein
MNIIRYAIRKLDLQELLRSLGILQKAETLHSVNNADLMDPTQELVVVTVAADAPEAFSSRRMASFSDRELHERYLLHTLMQKEYREQLGRIEKALETLKEEWSQRMLNGTTSGEVLPREIDQYISRQIKEILTDPDLPTSR